MRHEKKYRIQDASLLEVQQVLLTNPNSFGVAFPNRFINSIYFDSADLGSFHQNQDGVSERVKYRIRWYGEDLKVAKNPQLEIKIRNNEFGKKEIVALPDFKLDDLAILEAIAKKFIPQELMPKVITRYERKYFVTQNQVLRATIDSGVSYYGFDGYKYKTNPSWDEAIILELKCKKEEVAFLAEVCQYIPFRIQKNSKYVNGVFATGS